MSTKIFAGLSVVLLAVLLLASVPIATAATKADRDLFQCTTKDGSTVLPPFEELKTCMVDKRHSSENITRIIESQPDQELYAPYVPAEVDLEHLQGGGGGE